MHFVFHEGINSFAYVIIISQCAVRFKQARDLNPSRTWGILSYLWGMFVLANNLTQHPSD